MNEHIKANLNHLKNNPIEMIKESTFLTRFNLCQVVVGEKFQQLSKDLGVTIVTHGSVEKLHWLHDTSNTWNGPVSVVVFVPDREFDVAQFYISFLR